jgi:uncharacterized membrane protein YbhN (UPF0104 family)
MVAKVLATLALGLLALRKLDLDSLRQTIGSLGPGAWATLVALTFAQIALSAHRWRRVLHYLGETVPTSLLVRDTLVGTTYNLLLPTTVGGDVVRIWRCSARTRDPHHAWASVFFERIMGLIGLALLPLLGLAFEATKPRPILLIPSVAAFASFALLIMIGHVPLRTIARLTTRRVRWLSNVSDKLATAFAGPLATKGARAETFAWSLAYQIIALSMLLVVGPDWLDPAMLRSVYIGVPLVLILSMVPITIAGLGLRESLFVSVLPVFFGLPRALAGTLAIVWLAANVACALVGAAILLLEWARGARAPRGAES